MISIVTPSIRLEFLEIVGRCLERQTYKDFEWLIVSPFNSIELDRTLDHGDYVMVTEPSKKEGDYYNLNKAWNAAFKIAQGELIVSIVDGLWFPPATLEKLWNHYEANSKVIVGAIGNQYDEMENGKPEHMVWRDPRARMDQGSFYEVEPTEVEWCISSIPRQALLDVGGMDEEYDKGAALSEKEANLRMQKVGYSLYLDQSIEYRAIYHPRLSKEWDDKYKIACDLYSKHVREVLNGTRGRLDFLG